MYNVVCVGTFHQKGIELLASRPELFTFHVLTDLSAASIARGVTDADAIIVRTSPLPKETLALAPILRIVSSHGVGTDNIDVA